MGLHHSSFCRWFFGIKFVGLKMSPAEQKAFVKAYAKNVAFIKPEKVAAFVSDFANDINLPYTEDYTHIMDALLMWFDAINWKLTELQENL